jgi:hypothetical protein
MRLMFKRLGFGFVEKEVPITLKIATLESLCDDNNLEFYELGDTKKISEFDFMAELLYHGYIIACKDKFKKPKYTKIQALIWNEKLSLTARNELKSMMTELTGKASKMTTKKKVEVK